MSSGFLVDKNQFCFINSIKFIKLFHRNDHTTNNFFSNIGTLKTKCQYGLLITCYNTDDLSSFRAESGSIFDLWWNLWHYYYRAESTQNIGFFKNSILKRRILRNFTIHMDNEDKAERFFYYLFFMDEIFCGNCLMHIKKTYSWLISIFFHLKCVCVCVCVGFRGMGASFRIANTEQIESFYIWEQ